jgi:nucleoside-diphosphate-sugar epimerase
MKVLVTGNTGYLGPSICAELARAGHVVDGFDMDYYKSARYAPLPAGLVGKQQHGDIRDISARDFKTYDAVVHLAGLSNDPLGDIDPDLTDQINHRGAVAVAKAAKAAGVRRIVMASTCSVYGASSGDMLDETSGFAPVTAYAVSKLKMEEGVSALADAAFSPVFLRSGTVYGLSPAMRFDLVVNNLTAWAVSTGEIRLKSDGLAWRPIVHVDDVAKAFAFAAAAPRDQVHGAAFNVAISAENFRIFELAEAIKTQIPEARIVYGQGAGADQRTYRVSGEKLAAVMGRDWAQTSLSEGVAGLVAAFRAKPVGPEQFEGPVFQRVAHLRKLQADGALDGGLRWAMAGG